MSGRKILLIIIIVAILIVLAVLYYFLVVKERKITDPTTGIPFATKEECLRIPRTMWNEESQCCQPYLKAGGQCMNQQQVNSLVAEYIDKEACLKRTDGATWRDTIRCCGKEVPYDENTMITKCLKKGE